MRARSSVLGLSALLSISFCAAVLFSSASAFAQYVQQGPKLGGNGAVGNTQVGSSVALSADGNTALMGGPFDKTSISDNANTGAAWVFTRSGEVWTQQGPKLVGTGAIGAATQGGAVTLSADGNTALVGGGTDNCSAFGCTGAAWLFTRSGGEWTQQAKLVGTGVIGSRAGQGKAVALSADGNTALVGGPGDNNSTGAVWVFTRSGDVWTQEAKLIGSGASGLTSQGFSVALSTDGNTALLGGGPLTTVVWARSGSSPAAAACGRSRAASWSALGLS